ncbi:hypothetical protein CALCODRAFT_345708 [Calocera cornea HHB12733]|uniref:Secreted protein n=1 Tax=Calocera cornea HHB12733 TaxID=1353952 RepID=A0A165EV43_9BASI|nr:hypothetical protein CALCODRAFT_345708 [Calocera cornea HHB12733]
MSDDLGAICATLCAALCSAILQDCTTYRHACTESLCSCCMFDGSSESFDNRARRPEDRAPLLDPGLQQLDADVVSQQPAPKPPITNAAVTTISEDTARI